MGATDVEVARYPDATACTRETKRPRLWAVRTLLVG